MKKLTIVLGFLTLLFLAGTALAETFVVGPATLGHPADDPSVGYSAMALDQQAGADEDALSSRAAEPLPRPWEESWYQQNLFAGV